MIVQLALLKEIALVLNFVRVDYEETLPFEHVRVSFRDK